MHHILNRSFSDFCSQINMLKYYTKVINQHTYIVLFFFIFAPITLSRVVSNQYHCPSHRPIPNGTLRAPILFLITYIHFFFALPSFPDILLLSLFRSFSEPSHHCRLYSTNVLQTVCYSYNFSYTYSFSILFDPVTPLRIHLSTLISATFICILSF